MADTRNGCYGFHRAGGRFLPWFLTVYQTSGKENVIGYRSLWAINHHYWLYNGL
jgi:hypothetical protein